MNKKIVDRKAELKSANTTTPASNKKTPKMSKKFLEKMSKLNSSPTAKNAAVIEPTLNGTEVKVKKVVRKRKGSEKSTNPTPERRLSGGKKISRRKSSATVNSSDVESNDAGNEDENEDGDRNQQHLRSWIDQYEEAVTNHYSQELRARLSGNKFTGLGNELKTSVIGGPTRCNVSLKGNGIKVSFL